MRKILIAIGIAVAGIIIAQQALAQKIDQEKMDRDLEVAETVLSSMLQKSSLNWLRLNKNSSSKYVDGYGVTINIPFGAAGFAYTVKPSSIAHSRGSSNGQEVEITFEEGVSALVSRNSNRLIGYKNENEVDSIRAKHDEMVLQIVKEFLIDYGDLIGQLKDSDKIIVKDMSESNWWFFSEPKSGKVQNSLSAEIKKSDLNAYKAGKISRDEAVKRIKVTHRNTEQPIEQDLELLASIFNRLYRSDLSKTYYLDGRTYYERMQDYGVIYGMNVYSSQSMGKDKYYMPTIGARDLSQADRDKKVKELYPQFEKELKENMLEYGRTIRSLKDDEQLIFNIKLTKCEGCGIPSTLEASVKASVLKEYNAGKTDKNSALNKINIKKGPNQ